MKANAVPLVALFEKKMRLEVPLFQRQYVWNQEQQWAPLWEDIERKFIEYLEGRSDVPVHFLGAIVLDQKQTPATHVERRLVIDGQQRLTTLQVFLNAFRDFCRASQADALADECSNFTLNKGMMPDPAVDKFKVWPTQLDRASFRDVVEAGSPVALEKLHPLTWRKYQRKPDPRPRLVECYLYFYSQLREFFEGGILEQPLGAEHPISERLEQCFQALRNALCVVAIDLEQGDDAQVIFETLNARGQALLPADLLRNYIFLRATRHGESAEELYHEYWSGFDEDYWRESVSQGRINRPRSDLFMQHFLSSQQAVDIPIGHLYVEYRHWIEKSNPFPTVRDELSALAKQRKNFRALLEVERDRPYSSLSQFLKSFDMGTAYPFMLYLLEAGLSDQEVSAICTTVESYLLRRAVCGLTNKNYNRVFLQLTRQLRRETADTASVVKYLSELRGESTEWPTDEAFFSAWQGKEIYRTLNNPRLVFILTKLNNTFASNKTETITIEDPLSVEHLMPQGWITHWPLPDGTPGLSDLALWEAAPEDPCAGQTKTRNHVIQTAGNLTILRQALNSSASDGEWADKRQEIMTHSLLPINLMLHTKQTWGEIDIEERGRVLFDKARTIWPRLSAEAELPKSGGNAPAGESAKEQFA